MSTGVSVHSRIPAIMVELPKRLEAAALVVAEEVATQARARAPVETGRLRDSIEAKPVTAGAGVECEFYGHFQEFGTVNQPAHPFLIPALEQTRLSVGAVVAAALRNL